MNLLSLGRIGPPHSYSVSKSFIFECPLTEICTVPIVFFFYVETADRFLELIDTAFSNKKSPLQQEGES